MDAENHIPKLDADKYSAMSVYDLYTLMTTACAVKQVFNLTCMAADAETPGFDWADGWEKKIDEYLLAMSKSMAGRMNLDGDDEDVRDMAFARIDGYVPADIWHDGRALRMRTAADLRRVGA